MQYMTYKEKLQSENWRIKRFEILKQDNFTCKNCSKLGYTKYLELNSITIKGQKKHFEKPLIIPNEDSLELNVHHICYRRGKEPWEYKNEELVTLCPECHKKTHEDEVIPIINEYGNIIVNTVKCDRCNGYGFIPKYYHIQSGICFKCWGEGIELNSLI